MDYKALIATNLNAAIDRAKLARPDLSINELGREAGIAPNTIKNMLEGNVSPRWENLEKVARALRIAPHTLVIPEDEARLLSAYQKADAESREFLLKSADLTTRKGGNQ